MAWQFGSVTLAIDEEPDEGEVQFINPRKWAFANTRGATGRLKQKLYNDAREIRLHFLLSAATVADLQAVYEADQAITHINPRPPYDAGVSMLMTEFDALWNGSVRGEDHWFDCNMILVED
jgi:hypothetical protein